MTRFVVGFYSYRPNEVVRFRIFPQDNPAQWIAQTNPYLPREVQEEAALLMAQALSHALGRV
jgi:hypothetical protein